MIDFKRIKSGVPFFERWELLTVYAGGADVKNPSSVSRILKFTGFHPNKDSGY
ncbi:hypothetical protein [Neisseria polysaccharea]|uniref:hypothetical protein n=1 Tax=Neisseria polysaccharea TaxID=489 RepID=UPI0001D9D6CA|nr:hypothetical protein [Neisseria polysaccharea]EFH21835.1 hypothetical protein NEIPOLOT_02365 [Neisseria polysaccharea ATCC 43768]